MSARTDLLDELVLRLNAVTGAPNYNYTMRSASWKDFRLPDEHKHFPVAHVLVDVTRMSGGQIGNMTQTDIFPVLVWGYVKATQRPQEVAEKLLADMSKAVVLNRTTGVKDLTLSNLCAAMLIRTKDVIGDLTSERRTVEMGLEFTMHLSPDAI